MVSDMYDPQVKNLHQILGAEYFPDEHFQTPTMLKFLKECGLRSYIPTETCKKIMESVQTSVKQTGWNNEVRKRSKFLYEHLLKNWRRYDNSILEMKFLEPHQMQIETDSLLKVHEQFTTETENQSVNDHFRFTSIRLTDGHLLKDSKLCWTSSYILPEFVRLDYFDDRNDQIQPIEEDALQFFKLNRKPPVNVVQRNLENLSKKFSMKYQHNL